MMPPEPAHVPRHATTPLDALAVTALAAGLVAWAFTGTWQWAAAGFAAMAVLTAWSSAHRSRKEARPWR